MASEYSFAPVQTVANGANVSFSNGSRCCKKGFIQHRDSAGIFVLKGNGCCNCAQYKVRFDGNIAIATGGTVESISVALTLNGEPLSNATAIVTPAAIGDYFHVSIDTIVDIPCGCCQNVSVRNTSATTAIDVQNANIIFERIA